jgi:predicted double-glycine peptidase
MPQLGDRQPYSGPDSPLLLLGREPGPHGTYGRPAPDAPLPRDPNNPALWLPGQGQANACGTTSLAYVLRYLLGPSAPDRYQIDRSVRRANIFTAPGLLVAYARRLGLTAERYEGVELDEMLALVDRGLPVMVLTDTTPLDLTDTANLHWVCLVGHDGDRLAVYNPHGFQEEVDRASFESHWREARLFGLRAWSRLAIAVAPAGADVPAPGRVRLTAVGATWAAGGVAGIVNGMVSLRQQAFREGPSLSSLAVIPGLLGLTVPTAQAVAGTAVLLGAAAAARLRDRG